MFDPDTLQIVNATLETATRASHFSSSAMTLVNQLQKAFHAPQLKGESALEARMTIAALSGQVADTQMANSALKEQVMKLHEAAVQAQQQKEDFERYHLVKIPETGTTVLRLKNNDPTGEPTHDICPSCKQAGYKVILQPKVDEFHHVCARLKHCNRCDTVFPMQPEPGMVAVGQVDESALW